MLWSDLVEPLPGKNVTDLACCFQKGLWCIRPRSQNQPQVKVKAIYGHAPYLRNLIHIKNSSMNGLRSNAELLLAPPSTKTKKTLGDSAFTAAAPSLRNKLASEIRDEDNFERFKSKLKTFLFRAAYPTIST